MEQHDCDESQTLLEIHAERSQNCHRFCKVLSQQKHFVLQSTAPLQLNRFKVGNKMAIAASAPVLPNQKKSVAKSPDSLTQPVHRVYTKVVYNLVRWNTHPVLIWGCFLMVISVRLREDIRTLWDSIRHYVLSFERVGLLTRYSASCFWPSA